MLTNTDIAVPRNGHYHQLWQLLDNEGLPIDITGDAFAMDARPISGGGAVVAAAVIATDDAVAGQFTVTWAGADFDAFGSVTEPVRLAYDLKRTFVDGIIEIPVRGHIILIPEVTV